LATDERATDLLQGVTSYGSMMTALATASPDTVALVVQGQGQGALEGVAESDVLTRAELEGLANRLARDYQALGVNAGDFVTIALPNSLEFFTACLAVWKLGAVPNPVSHLLPRAERAAIVERANPTLVVGVLEEGDDEAYDGRPCLPQDYSPRSECSDPLVPITSPSERAMASGGSTGLPKLIVAVNAAQYDPQRASPLFKGRRAVLVPGPLYHGAPFSSAWQGLFSGCRVVVMQRFDALKCIQLIEQHSVDRMMIVPTMMQRIWRLPEAQRVAVDMSSLEFVLSGGAPCPAWLMRSWIEWLGPTVMNEAFGPSERTGGTFITGTEWLEHPGSVGKPSAGAQLKILDDQGSELAPGEMGEIYMMPAGGTGSTYRYVGAQARVTEDGWESVGDMGYFDADGYLYLGDRRSDMVICGGRNIYPAEVEAAIDAHPHVRSSAVIGLPDEDRGQRLHAIVDIGSGTADVKEQDLREHLAQQLVHYKVPTSIEIVSSLLRDDAGKMRRSALRDARLEDHSKRG
jgi:bile acid-coenzyme A ligase